MIKFIKFILRLLGIEVRDGSSPKLKLEEEPVVTDAEINESIENAREKLEKILINTIWRKLYGTNKRWTNAQWVNI